MSYSFKTLKIFGGQIGNRPILFGLFYFILVPVFQVVRFPNDACEISGGSYNGTCYTALVFLIDTMIYYKVLISKCYLFHREECSYQ